MTKGQRIRRKREEKNISQIELANRLGIKNQTMFKYEKDIITNIPSDMIEKIANILECSPAYIMGWDSENNSDEPHPSDIEKAMELYKKYESLSPENQIAFQTLLKNLQS